MKELKERLKKKGLIIKQKDKRIEKKDKRIEELEEQNINMSRELECLRFQELACLRLQGFLY